MADRGSLVFPLALAGLFLLGSTRSSRPTHSPTRTLRFRMLMGPPGKTFMVPVEIDPREIVLFFREFRDGLQNGTVFRVKKPHMSEDLCLVETPREILSHLQDGTEPFIKVHLPVGRTDPRVGPEWEDEPSLEVAPVWVNVHHIKEIGPSELLHTQRKLGKIYTTDGIGLEIYESLEDLQRMLPHVPRAV